MYRAIIIDDEEIVRNGIKDLIDWSAAGFEVCAMGINGRDGLHKIIEYQPHLVLVDIKMPGLSGLEVIHEAKKQGFEGHFIVLTGFSEFEYAKSAISLGVKEYLLKPINEQELALNIKAIFDELQEQERNQKTAQNDLFRRILFNQEERTVLEEQIKFHKIEFKEKMYCIAVISAMDNNNHDYPFYERQDELLKGYESNIEKIMMAEEIALICFGMDFKQWTTILHNGNNRVQRKFGLSYRIAVGHNVSNWYDFCFSYEFARYLLKNEFLFSDQHVVSPDSIKNCKEERGNTNLDYLALLVEVGNLEEIQRMLEDYKYLCIQQLCKESEIKTQLIFNAVFIKEKLLKKYRISKSIENTLVENMNQLISTDGFDELIKLYYELLQFMCRQIVQNDSGTIVKRVLHYMEHNYKEDIKLKNIAPLFHYNSNYLGTLFKTETGATFNVTLDKIRIAKAQKMLDETDWKVYQIAEEVGYFNLDYFYSKFKKYVNISPNEYRKKRVSP